MLFDLSGITIAVDQLTEWKDVHTVNSPTGTMLAFLHPLGLSSLLSLHASVLVSFHQQPHQQHSD